MKLKSISGMIAVAISLSAVPALAKEKVLTPEEQAAADAAAAELRAANEAAVGQLTSEFGLAPTSAPADGCELHLWPAERMTSITTGLLGGGLIDAMLHSGTDANNKTLISSALDSPSQLDALLQIDLRKELSLTPGTTVVLHAQPLERKTMNKVKTRRSDSQASCYSELIVADVFYQKAMIYGRSLRTLFMFRDFGSDQKIDTEYKAWGGNGLSLFPPKEGEDAVAALDELVTKYKLNFTEYANNARTKLAAAKKSKKGA
ncbi:hypothetical protein SZ64_16935 [Erythrobacter sp. SG61-1L]|uniref:hypothetical protein n=1 Tax=Erythrobacter sp. SG61-1L TaxID=1603897 RepID=UPI0006C8F51F|nr:hypothetical protein [Erythrobacter sp. SG61-1L]KPL69631.1 hypothetical protein SZ64_16935 [Erythrobacter sp. SG61-1L]